MKHTFIVEIDCEEEADALLVMSEAAELVMSEAAEQEQP